jgi:hypothetical protein
VGPQTIYIISVNASGEVGLESNNFRWYCEGEPEAVTNANFGLIYNDHGGFTASSIASDTAVRDLDPAHVTVNYTLNFANDVGPPDFIAGTGTVDVAGTYNYGTDGIKGCHVHHAFTFYRSGP